MCAYNSTIISKKKKLACGCWDYPFSKGRCKMHATIEDTNKRIKKHEESGDGELDELKLLKEDCDREFSLYIRLRETDEIGFVQCFTCQAKKYYTDGIQCGHFVSRKASALRFSPFNCRPQCVNCNEYLSGNLEMFAVNLELEQQGIVEHLKEVGREVYKFTRSELKGILLEYRSKVKLLKQKLK